MKRLVVALMLAASGAAAAAPIAIERQLAPKSALVDPRFETAAATSVVVVDHAAWSRFLGAYVLKGANGINLVRYGAVTAADKTQLAGYIAALEATDVAALTRNEQLAFWFNLYNAATVKIILDNSGVASIRDIKKPWDTPVATVNGRALSLNEIEHGIIRPIAQDPRIHYAVNCASLGCPDLALEAFAGATIDAQLDAAARAYVNHPRGVSVDAGKITLSKIYGWYRDDFGKTDADVLDHIRKYATPALAEKLKGAKKVAGYGYDWALNTAP